MKIGNNQSKFENNEFIAVFFEEMLAWWPPSENLFTVRQVYSGIYAQLKIVWTICHGGRQSMPIYCKLQSGDVAVQ